jgi:expansin (peptidoglycan-binding protein)
MPSQTAAFVSFLTLFLAIAHTVAALSTPYNSPFTGDGTYYGESDGGNCGLNNPVPSMYAGMVPVAMNKEQYEESAICGACLSVTGTGEGSGANPIKGTFAAFVSDQCPECKRGDIDLAQSGDGRWKVTWEVVPCPGVTMSDIVFQFEGSNPYYYKIQPRQMRSPATRVTVGAVECTRTSDNHFVCQSSAGFPTTVEVQVWTVLGDHYVNSVTGYSGVVRGSSAPGGSTSAPSSTTRASAARTSGTTATLKPAEAPATVSTTKLGTSPVSVTAGTPSSTTYTVSSEGPTTTAKNVYPSTVESKTVVTTSTKPSKEVSLTLPQNTPSVPASKPYQTPSTGATSPMSTEPIYTPAATTTRHVRKTTYPSKGRSRSGHRWKRSKHVPISQYPSLPKMPINAGGSYESTDNNWGEDDAGHGRYWW